jgi:outer membrane immunogenic protein
VFNWTGCYLGGQAGGGFMHDSLVDDNDDPIFHGGGPIAGGQVGCNYQAQQFVVGVEGEGWWSGLKNKSTDNSTTTTTNGIDVLTVTNNSFDETKNRWDAAVSLRAGWAVDRLLFYGKAGVVWGGFNFSSSSNEVLCFNATCGVAQSSQFGSHTLTGMLLGFGIEWAFLDNWLFRMEADYLNFPRTDVSSTFSSSCTLICGPTPIVQSGSGVFSEFASKGLLKVGLSYKFY